MTYLFDIEEPQETTLFSTGQTNLFHSRGTSLFWTTPSVGRILEPLWSITGMSVSALDLTGTYNETSSVKEADAQLYFSIGTFDTPEELIATNKTTGTDVVPFTNADPVPNPGQDAGAVVPHTELNNITFSACYANTTHYSSIFTATGSNFDVSATYLDASFNIVEFVPESNRIKMELRVDTTYLDSWLTLKSAIVLFDYLSSVVFIDYQLLYNPIYGSETITNSGAGGHTPPFTQRFSGVIQDAVGPYYYGNYSIFNFELILLSESGNLTDFIGNPSLSMTNPGNFQFYNGTPTITNQYLTWNGISDFELYEDRIVIIKSGTWTSSWSFTRNGGTAFTIPGTITTLFTNNTNGDVIEVSQPFTGTPLTKTFLKSLSVSYTNNPPNSYTADVVLVGVPLPATIDIKSGGTTITSITQTTQTQTTGDLRTLGVYGLGVVSFEVDTLATNFDASYYNDGVFIYSGSEIQGYNITTAENIPSQITWTFNGTRLFETAGEDLYFGDYGTLFDLINNATPDATSFITSYSDSDFVSPAVYTSDTPIPAVNKSGIRAVLFDNTLNIQSPVYVGSASKSVSADYFTSDFGTFYLLDSTQNLLTCRIAIQTAFNTEWRLLGSAVIRLEYDDTIIQPSSTTQQLYEDSGDSFGDPSGIQRYRVVPVGGTSRAGTFDLIDIVFEVFASSSISTALNVARLTSIQDETSTEYLALANMDITDTNFFWVGINDFTFTATSITITKNAQGSYSGNWSYRINSGTIIPVSWSLDTATGLSLLNGDIVEVFQPINGTDITKTISGLTFSFTFVNPTFSSGNVLALNNTYDDPQGLCLHPLGSAMGIYDDDGGTHRITIYDMFPAFDILTAVNTPSNTLTPNRTNGRGLFIDGNNGHVYYVRAIAGTDQLVQEIPSALTSLWNSITLSGVNNAVGIPQGATNIASVKGITFYGGNRCVISGVGGGFNVINIYDFTTTPLGLTLINQFTLSGNDYEGLDAKPDGTKLYAIDNSGDIYEHDFTGTDTINTTPTTTKSLSTILGGSYPGTSNWVGISIDRTNGNSVFVVNGINGNLNSQVFKINL